MHVYGNLPGSVLRQYIDRGALVCASGPCKGAEGIQGQKTVVSDGVS